MNCNNPLRLSIHSLLLALFFSLLFPVLASAQTSAGVGISPSLIEEGADPGSVLERDITITNLSETTNTYYLFSRDITGVRDGGQPIFANENAEKTGYELTQWLTLPVTEITLPPGGGEQIKITISVPDNATPGSHFGGVFVSLQPPKLREVGAAVGFEVANIISIRISGDAVEKSDISSFYTDKYIYGTTSVEFTAEVANKGNVLVRPYGPLEIYNMFDKKVATINFNEQLGGVFPASSRTFKLLWTDNGPAIGKYLARITLVYGEKGNQKTITAETAFWIFPGNIIKPALIVLAVLIGTTYFGVRLYIKRKLQHLSHSRHQLRRRRPSILFPVMISVFAVTGLFLLLLLVLFA